MKTLNIGSGKYKDNNGEWSTLPCLKGDKGENGESAYQLAVRLGTFTGTEEEYNEQFFEIVRKTNAAEKSIKEAENKIQENIKNIGSLSKDLKTKINIPLENPEIGKVLKVKSINEDGTFVCEWADSASNLDVQINGKSIVQNGTAEIPLCTKTKEAGLISIDTYSSNGGLHRANNATGLIRIASATNNQIDERRNQFCPIVPETIDYTVKAAMCDGKGAAWTNSEQAAARERMGIGEWELVADITLEEDAILSTITTDIEGNPFTIDAARIIVITPPGVKNDEGFIVPNAANSSIRVTWKCDNSTGTVENIFIVEYELDRIAKLPILKVFNLLGKIVLTGFGIHKYLLTTCRNGIQLVSIIHQN